MVATNDCHYIARDDAEAHEVLLCIQTGKTMQDPDRFRFATDQLYLKSPEEMAALFPEAPEALENTLRVAERCELTLDSERVQLPAFPIPPEFESEEGYLRRLAREGLERRYPEITPDMEQRLHYELDTICQVGYARYFLIVRDFTDYARENAVGVGPGRGSAAGSLVSYCLGITDIDPLRFELLFERFLNPERVSMPDIDIDFAYESRQKVIDYVIGKYGRESVSQIITFGTMAARAVVRDVGRALGMTYAECDLVAKMIPPDLGMTLTRALEIVPELRSLVQKDERYARLIRCSLALEGLARHASTHAAGVLIAPGQLTDYVPMYKSPKGDLTTQFDMKSLERVGLLKMDFLGLRTLTVLDDTVRIVRESTGRSIDLGSLELDDPATYALLQKAQTVGIFQLESGGMRDLLRKVLPDTFEDIIAINALFRPGPIQSGMIDDFAKRKHGKQRVAYPHPSLEPILKKTYGVIVYQDQVMQVANRLAGFTLAQADLLRRAMGKKKPEEMASQKSAFVEGCAKNKVREQESGRDLRPHGEVRGLRVRPLAQRRLRDALVSLRVSQGARARRVSRRVLDQRGGGHGPDRHAGGGGAAAGRRGASARRERERGRVHARGRGHPVRAHRRSRTSVKGRWKRWFARARRAGPFRTLGDMIRRVETSAINRRVLESLIQAGACDRLEGDRAQLLEAVGDLLAQAQDRARGVNQSQENLFGADHAVQIQDPPLPQTPPWPLEERLRRERDVLGFYFSDHPLAAYRGQIAARANADTAKLRELKDNAEVTLVCLVAGVKSHTDRNKRPMAFVTLEDMKGTVEATVFADLYERSRAALQTGVVVEVRGKVNQREDAIPKMLLNAVQRLGGAGLEAPRAVHIDLVHLAGAVSLEEIRELLVRHPGESPVYFSVAGSEGLGATRILAKRILVRPSDELLRALRERLGEGAVRVANGHAEAVPF